jgi:thiol-disulfide isomerase/thioredoxin
MLRKFIYAVIIFVVFMVVLTIGQIIFVYGGDVLRFRHHMEMFKAPVDVSAFEFTDVAGNPHAIKDTNGKPRILMMWATWCRYCQTDMPKVAQFVADGLAEGIVILPIAIPTDTPSGVTHFFEQYASSALTPYLSPTPALHKALSVPGVPYYVYVNPQGYAMARLQPKWESDLTVLLNKAH